MPSLVYAHPRDNLLRIASSITVTVGATQTGYGTDKLHNSAWADPCKGTGVDLSIVFAFDDPVLPDLAALLNSNLDVAASLQGNATDSWGAPTVDEAFAAPTMNARGFFTSPHLSLAALDPSATAQLFWRLHIVGNARTVHIGEFYMGPRRTLAGYLYQGLSIPLRGHSVVNPTYMDVPLAYEQVPGHRGLSGSLVVSGAGKTAVYALIDSARYRARPFVLIPRDDVNDAWLVTFVSDDIPEVPLGPDLVRIGPPVAMVSRGLPWVEPDDED